VKVIVVGAGGTTRDLLRGLGDVWDPVVVDPRPDQLAVARALRPVETVVGDGSSRVVLRRAHLDEADAVVAATPDDDVNLEVCRLALDAEVPRVLSISADPDRLGEFRELGVAAFSPDRLVARRLGLNLEPRGVASSAFADGRATAVELRIGFDSPVVGKTLEDLHAERWLIAAILREGRLIVPKGSTRLAAGDLVTVVGAAPDYSLIVRSFLTGQSQFPLSYGTQVAVTLESIADLDGVVAEAANLTRNTAAENLFVIHRSLDSVKDDAEAADLRAALDRLPEAMAGLAARLRPVDGPATMRLAEVTAGESIGVLVTPAAVRRRLGSGSLGGMLRSLRNAGFPVLFSRGLGHYEEIVYPVRGQAVSWDAARASMDLAESMKAVLVGVAGVPPLVGPADGRDHALRVLGRLREEATVRGVSMRRRVRRGSLAKVIEETTGPSLVVVGLDRGSGQQASISTQLIRRAQASVLAVPERGRS
jgi:Trk K+ transport system NAD-binding subunit